MDKIDLRNKSQDVAEATAELSAEQLSSVSGGTHNIDKASTVLMSACATGKHFPKATITV